MGSLFEMGRNTRLKIIGWYLGTEWWFRDCSSPFPLPQRGVLPRDHHWHGAHHEHVHRRAVWRGRHGKCWKCGTWNWPRWRDTISAFVALNSVPERQPLLSHFQSVLSISTCTLLVSDSFQSEKTENVALKYNTASLQESPAPNYNEIWCWGTIRDENQKILVLQATTAYAESFIILILFCICRVSCVRLCFPS